MKNLYKKNLFGLLLMVACLMNIAHGYAQNTFTTSTFRSISSENGMTGVRPAMNDNGRAINNRGWYYYDDGVNVDAIGLTNGGSFYWGVMFPSGSYTGNAVTKVKMYDYAAHTGNIMIYQGGSSAPGTLVYTQAYACTGSESFVEWTLSSPVAVNSNQNLWIVMHNNDGQYVAPVCDNTGNPNGRWISTDGSSWTDLASVNDLNYTWMLRAYLETINSYNWDFESGIPNGWTTIDADGDGYNWVLGSVAGGVYLVEGASLAGSGHNASQDMMCSGSWTNMTQTILYPDNYLVSPPMTLVSGSTFSFWACAQDASYSAEHFGVFVSSNGTNNWTMVNEWTLTAKSNGAMSMGRDGDVRSQGNWHQYSVNLSNFAGTVRYIAIRHFNSSDQFLIDIDDIVLSTNTQYYTITVSANPANGGTVSGGGSYPSGSTCTLHATPSSGYTFVKWTKNGTQVSTSPNYSFTVTGNATYVAHFQQNVTYYTITATASPTNGGTVTGGGSYASGTTCTLHALANSGYTFVNWTKNGAIVSTNPNYSFTVTGNASYVAHFEQNVTYYTITVTASPTNGGTVTGGGSYASGSTCTLHAVANSGYTFVKWTKNGTQVSTNPDYSFTVTSNATFVAHFQLSNNNYTINVLANPTAGGTVTGGGTYQQGQECIVTATVNEGYDFVNWTENGNEVSGSARYSFIVNGNRVLVANFVLKTYNITVTVDPTEGGSVSGQGTYNYGDECALIATPNNGYTFDGWEKNGSFVTNNPAYSFIVIGDASYVAHFVQSISSFTITASADPAEGGSVTGGGNYNQGEECTLTATPNNGYTFVNWTKNGSSVSEEQSFSFAVTENASYVAHFTHSVNGYTISVSADPIEGGIVTGTGIYAPGLTCTLTATANEGYKFTNWTENGVIQWLTDQYEFVVDRDRTLVANFEALPKFTVTAMAGANGTITPQGDVQVVQGADQTFTMTPDFGARIVKVLVDGIDIGAVEEYTFTNVNRDHTIYVSFSGMGVEEAEVLNVNVYPNPAKDMVYVVGEGIEAVALYDMLGNCLCNMDYNFGKKMNVLGLSQGTYILRLTTQDGRVGYKKLIVTD